MPISWLPVRPCLPCQPRQRPLGRLGGQRTKLFGSRQGHPWLPGVAAPVVAPSRYVPRSRILYIQPKLRGNVFIMRCLLSLIARGERYNEQRPAGIVTSRMISQEENFIAVTVTSNLSSGYYHWYADGAYMGCNEGQSRCFRIEPGRQMVVEVKPVRWSSYRGRDRDLPAYDGTLLIEWGPSTNATYYLAQYQPSGGSWTTFAKIHEDGRWCYHARTPQLDDDTIYNLRVMPMDAADGAGTPLDLGSRRVVRFPDVIDADITFDDDTDKFTFDEV